MGLGDVVGGPGVLSAGRGCSGSRPLMFSWAQISTCSISAHLHTHPSSGDHPRCSGTRHPEPRCPAVTPHPTAEPPGEPVSLL